MSHPSFLALDAHALTPTAEIAAHVAQCPECAAHLKTLNEVPPLPLAVMRKRTPVTRYVVSAIALAAALVLIVGRTASKAEIITAKGGAPAVQVWVKRGDSKVRAWAGEAVRVGEAVRFEVAPAGYSHLAVVELKPTPHVIYEVMVTGTQPTLTPAWALDAEGETEDLAVLLTRAPLQPDAREATTCQSSADHWCSRFTLHKQPKETP